MIKQRKILFVSIVVVLILLNIWRWWPASIVSSERGAQSVGSVGAFNLEDFEVKSLPDDVLPPLSRNLFQPKKIEIEKPQVKSIQKAITELPVKSKVETVVEGVELELSKIRCVAISVRNERVHAYLMYAGESFLVSKGDQVGGRFIVEAIVADGVTLRDPETGVSGAVSISGN